MTITILAGCCLSMLSALPDNSINTCVTSPPYYGLRDYGVAGQLGLESTPEEYVANMVQVFREVRRALRDDGTLWLNLGDSYAAKGASGLNEGWAGRAMEYAGGGHRAEPARVKARKAIPAGLKPKDLIGIPWMVAFALRADGWYLRSDIIWSKPNPMPESVTDRPTKSHEYLFLLSKSERYFYDAEAAKEPIAASSIERPSQNVETQAGSDRANAGGKTNGTMKAVVGRAKGNSRTFRGGGAYTNNRSFDNDASVGRESRGNVPNDTGLRNRRTVWEVSTVGFKEAHFATFPPRLIEPCILAGCPAGGTVLDPFFGAGTTGLVADRLGRNCIGVELNPAYRDLAIRRLREDAGMLADIVEA